MCLFLRQGLTHYVVQADLELMILLPQPPKCWDYSCVPQHILAIFKCAVQCINTFTTTHF
jgi:hypothetical protein